jgi:hypothetical protein
MRLPAFRFLFFFVVAVASFIVVIASDSEAIQLQRKKSGLLRRAANHRAGHFGPDPLRSSQ